MAFLTISVLLGAAAAIAAGTGTYKALKKKKIGEEKNIPQIGGAAAAVTAGALIYTFWWAFLIVGVAGGGYYLVRKKKALAAGDDPKALDGD